jgi:hypothetical protein
MQNPPRRSVASLIGGNAPNVGESHSVCCSLCQITALCPFLLWGAKQNQDWSLIVEVFTGQWQVNRVWEVEFTNESSLFLDSVFAVAEGDEVDDRLPEEQTNDVNRRLMLDTNMSSLRDGRSWFGEFNITR